ATDTISKLGKLHRYLGSISAVIERSYNSIEHLLNSQIKSTIKVNYFAFVWNCFEEEIRSFIASRKA
ncbi:MAG: hypothetical protein ACI9GE_000960, partial [Oceanospirillaceae bacterium]